MKKIVIYPHYQSLKEINTHRLVCAYFLNFYLSKYFNIIKYENLFQNENFLKKLNNSDENDILKYISGGMEKAIAASAENGAEYFITTIQSGISKIENSNYLKLKQTYPRLKLCSIHDHWGAKAYAEDYLFIAHPLTDPKLEKVLISHARNKNIKPISTGWCADHRLLASEPNQYFGIVLDHSALQSFRKDLTSKYIEAIRRLYKINNKVRVCRINMGFEFFDFNKNIWTRDESLRWWKDVEDPDRVIANGSGATVFQIAKCLNNSKIFCVTHVESCGLTAIEALMAGCKLYVPEGKDVHMVWGSKDGSVPMKEFNGTFIKRNLLQEYMDFTIINENEDFYKYFVKDLNFKVRSNRKLLIKNNSWISMAEKIYNSIQGS